MASFSDDRCEADGVCPSDPLTFTCEINGATVLRVVLPNGDSDIVDDRSDPDDVDLPEGFTVDSLVTTPADNTLTNFVLTLTISSASLLDGGEIRCDSVTGNNQAMAGCPILGKSCSQQAHDQLPMIYMITRPHGICASVHRNVYCIQE